MHIQDIYIYPIKSLGGIRLEKARLMEKGFENDRRFMLADKNGRFLSQREHPRMALLQTDLVDEGIAVYSKQEPENKTLIPLPFKPKKNGEILVTIWEDKVKARLADESISSWFSDFLGQACKLVYMPHASRRQLKPKYAVNGEAVSFADGMPYLLISQASLDDLNSRLKEPVSMNRFRPNIVISGGTAFQEDEWDVIQVGDARFKITKPCARCVVTTIDQQTGQKSKEPLTTLATYRQKNGKVMFGQNMLLLEGDQISVYDKAEPVKG
jgi:uncharacterized protein